MAERQILHVDMDAFFVSVEEILDPSLKGKPAIVGGDPNGRGVVAAASYEARRYGVHSAMPLATARRLCPNAIFLRGSRGLYAEFSERIFALLERYSPRVEPMSLDEAYLDLTGCELLQGPAFETAERIRNDIKKTVGINASVGVASNKLVAKIASDCAKPNGMLWVRAGYERAFLAPLPAGRLPGVGPKTEPRLNRIGIKTVGDLAALPRELLEEVFGQWGLELYLKARGICDSPVSKREGARSISRETTLDKDTADPRFLESTLSYLVEKAAAQLRESGLRAGCVTVKLRYSNFETFSHSRALSPGACPASVPPAPAGSARMASKRHRGQSKLGALPPGACPAAVAWSHLATAPSCEDHVLFQIAVRLFREMFSRRARVRLIGVAFTSLTPPGPTQTDLFKPDKERWDRLYRGIDRIRGKYGFHSILRAASRANARR